ncbi:MAG: S-layer homology domain-containing protein, partial [Dysosmobacter sp.]|nr:S-layer homology domain-containing protein [Dysosmobacter sp.]
YIKYVNVNTAKLYCGPLSVGGQEIAVLSPYTVFWDSGNLISSGVVWAEDCLYYVSTELELISYRLSDRESVSLGRIQFIPQSTADRHYDQSRDGISLLFDTHSGVLSAQSRNRGTDLGTWQIALPKMEFEDVTPEDYFFRPVQWAVEKGIAVGTSKTAFSPAQTCSRAQIITFLWRAMGSPEPRTAATVIDVKSDDYYYKAVLWAAENNMFSGDVFFPNTPCTRAMAVEFIWKQAGRPSASGCKFIDVPSSASYAQAVAWAISNGVTYGTSNTTFSPDANCTREQIITFLYRAFAE